MNNYYITIVCRRQGLFSAGSTLDEGGARTTHDIAPRRRRRTQKPETFIIVNVSVQFALLLL